MESRGGWRVSGGALFTISRKRAVFPSLRNLPWTDMKTRTLENRNGAAPQFKNHSVVRFFASLP
jgi:hypothetical protein